MSTADGNVHSGRPRDETIDDRVVDEAISLFGARGWSGFSIDAIARAARIGKASIYLRWESREALLMDALERRMLDVSGLDQGSLREDLRYLANQAVTMYLGPTGPAVLRMVVEAGQSEGLQERYRLFGKSLRKAAMSIVDRSLERGEITNRTEGIAMVNTVWGGCQAFVSSQTPESLPSARPRAEAYADWLIDRLCAPVSVVTQ